MTTPTSQGQESRVLKQEELKQWRELARRATAGPWEHDPEWIHYDGMLRPSQNVYSRAAAPDGRFICNADVWERAPEGTHENAPFIAFSSPDRVLEMLERVEAAEAAVREAALQITYLHEKFGETGSGNAVLAKLAALGASADGK